MKSYNQADTKISTQGGRLVISSDIKRRMRAVINAMTHLATSAHRDPVFMFELIQQVRDQDRTHTYSRTDIMYAIAKCVQAGVIQNVSHGVYRLTLDPKIARTTIK